MTGEIPLSIPQKRAAVAEYVESITAVTTREAQLSSVIEAALAYNILNEAANIPDEIIDQWYAALFESNADLPGTL